MEVVKLNNSNKISILSLANDVLNRGGTLVYPTETAYGIGADFFSPQAYRKVLRLKGRPSEKLLPVIVADINQARSLVKFHPTALALAEKHWPGPLTLVLPLVTPIHNRVFHGTTLALRVPSHPFALDLARIGARPLISTSANLHGEGTLYSTDQFVSSISGKAVRPDLIVDAGLLPEQLPSTIVSIDDNGKIAVLRQGAIKI